MSLTLVPLVVGMAIAVLSAAWLLGHLERIGALVVAGWRRVHPGRATSSTVPVEQLAADLRRLAAHLEATYDTDQPAKMQRVAAAALAYDWVLLSACRTLEVPEPAATPIPPLDPIDRLTVEAALARHGLTW
ncbi:MAG TPA: hypothetical protein VFN19_00180 [Candidatus Nanopelagicales bacterium]|nr:hypothetical protein [Candidatus Nanopelagicales bacterium]